MLNYIKGLLSFPSVSYIRIYYGSKETEKISEFIILLSLIILASSNFGKKQILK